MLQKSLFHYIYACAYCLNQSIKIKFNQAFSVRFLKFLNAEPKTNFNYDTMKTSYSVHILLAVQMATKNTMYYKGIFYGYGAGLLTQDKETEIKRNAEDKVAQTGCVKDRRCAHLKTEVGAYSNDDDGIMKREVQDVSFIVYISCNPAAGIIAVIPIPKKKLHHKSHVMRKPLRRFSTRKDSNRFSQLQKLASVLKFQNKFHFLLCIMYARYTICIVIIHF